MAGRRAGLAALALVAAAPLVGTAAEPDWSACAAAGAAAEQRFDIPGGLLRAIGQVESGRANPGGGDAPWPWTVQAAGEGRFLDNRSDAVTATQTLLARGIGSIDVGCFQVNLHYHPGAFASLDEAFDPVTNATYAARFLSELYAREGSWERAVALYHSASPEHGLPYRDRVMARWERLGPAPVLVAEAPAEPVVAYGVRVVVPARAGTAPMVIALSAVPGLPTLIHLRP